MVMLETWKTGNLISLRWDISVREASLQIDPIEPRRRFGWKTLLIYAAGRLMSLTFLRRDIRLSGDSLWTADIELQKSDCSRVREGSGGFGSLGGDTVDDGSFFLSNMARA